MKHTTELVFILDRSGSMSDAILYAETGYTAVEWKDSKYSYCFIADETFDTAVWQALVNSIK